MLLQTTDWSEIKISQNKSKPYLIAAFLFVLVVLAAACFLFVFCHSILPQKACISNSSFNKQLIEAIDDKTDPEKTFDDGLDIYRRAIPSYWEEGMEEDAQSLDAKDSLFVVMYLRSYQDEAGNERSGWDHEIYMSGAGKVIDVPGMDFTTMIGQGEVTWTQNGYLYPTRKDGLWGYIDPFGEWKIEPLYRNARPFYKGYAYVELPCTGPYTTPRFAYIDPFGAIVMEWADPVVVGPITEGKAIRYCLTDQKTAAIELIDDHGNVIASDILIDIDPAFLEQYGSRDSFRDTHHFSQGLLCASLNGKYGYLDEHGNWAIEPVYDYAEDFSEGRAVVSQGEKYGYIDLHGELVIPMIYTYAWPFSEGKTAVQLNNTTDREVQFIDKDGTVIFRGGTYGLTKTVAENPYVYKDGLCLVYRDDGWIFIDSEGNPIWDEHTPVIAARPRHGIFYEPTQFHNGLAEITDGRESFIVNKEGEILYYQGCNSGMLLCVIS